MRSIRQKSRILGAVVLTLLCLTMVSVPASASIEQMGSESGAEMNEPLRGQASSWADAFMSFLRDLGGFFAGQSGAGIVD